MWCLRDEYATAGALGVWAVFGTHDEVRHFCISLGTRLIGITCFVTFHALHGNNSRPWNPTLFLLCAHIITQACTALSLPGLPFAVATALESDLEPFHKLKRFVARPSVSHFTYFLRIYRFTDYLHTCLSPLSSFLPPPLPSTSLARPLC
jgi:hypothetical protein